MKKSSENKKQKFQASAQQMYFYKSISIYIPSVYV